MDDKIIRKLQKLQVIAERGETNEAKNARRIFEMLIDKYKIDPDTIEQKKEFTLKAKAADRKYLLHLCFSLGLKASSYKRKDSPLFIEATQAEFAILSSCYAHVKIVLREQRKALKLKMESYLSGFMHATYPVEQKDPICPKCNVTLKYSDEERRYFCQCGYKSKKVKVLSAMDYYAGANDSGRLLTKGEAHA